MKYSTKNIFVDTNIIEGNNFFHGSHLQSLLYYSRCGIIKLFMTSISKMELVDRIKKRLIDSKNDHNKLVRSLNKPNQRILKNLRQYEDLSLSPINIESSLNELTFKLQRIIDSAEIQIIQSDNVDVEKVFELYYNNLPPFSPNEKKRYEFPDAFILKTVENYCKENKTRMIFLTNDNDFNGYKSRNILFRNDLKNLLVSISEYYDSIQETQIIPFVKEQFESNMQELNQLISEEIKSLLTFDTDFENTTPLKYSGEISDYKVTSIRKGYAEVTCDFKLTYEFSVLPSTYDVDRIQFEDNLRPKKVRNKILVPCDLEVNTNENNQINLKWINSNQKIRIEYY